MRTLTLTVKLTAGQVTAFREVEGCGTPEEIEQFLTAHVRDVILDVQESGKHVSKWPVKRQK